MRVAKSWLVVQVSHPFDKLNQNLTCFSADDSKGFFVQPTVILTKDPRSITMKEEIFGPVVTVCGFLDFFRDPNIFQVYVFEDSDYEQTLDLIDTTSIYALTGAMWALDASAGSRTDIHTM